MGVLSSAVGKPRGAPPGARPGFDDARAVLGARCTWNAAFLVYLLLVAPVGLPSLVRAFAGFALVDGSLGLVMAGLARTLPVRDWVWPMAVVDGVARVGLGLLVLLVPGLPSYVVTLVLYLCVVATVGIVVGLLEAAAEWLRTAVGGRRRAHVLGVAGIAFAGAVALGVALHPGPGELRALLGAGALIQAAALFMAVRHPPVRATAGARA